MGFHIPNSLRHHHSSAEFQRSYCFEFFHVYYVTAWGFVYLGLFYCLVHLFLAALFFELKYFYSPSGSWRYRVEHIVKENTSSVQELRLPGRNSILALERVLTVRTTTDVEYCHYSSASVCIYNSGPSDFNNCGRMNNQSYHRLCSGFSL